MMSVLPGEFLSQEIKFPEFEAKVYQKIIAKYAFAVRSPFYFQPVWYLMFRRVT